MVNTLAELREEVRDALASRTDLTDERITRALNFGQERIARAPVHWKELERTKEFRLEKTRTEYPISEVFGGEALHEFYSWTYKEGTLTYKIYYVAPRRFWQITVEDSPSYPRYYTWFGDKLTLSNRPSLPFVSTLWYNIWPDKLVADNQTSELLNKDGIIVAFAVSHLFQSLGNSDFAARWFTIGDRLLNDARRSNDYVSDPKSAERSAVPYWLDPFVKSVST